MSTAHTRDPLDRYYTPPELIHAAIARIWPIWHPESNPARATVLEPSAGQLAIPRAWDQWEIERPAPFWTTNDLDTASPSHTNEDALSADWTARNGGAPYDLAITNPPFKHAAAFLRHMCAHSEAVALLVRASFMEPTLDRGEMLRSGEGLSGHTLKRIIWTPRVSFREVSSKSRTDTVTTAWMIWTRHASRNAPTTEFITHEELKMWKACKSKDDLWEVARDLRKRGM